MITLSTVNFPCAMPPTCAADSRPTMLIATLCYSPLTFSRVPSDLTSIDWVCRYDYKINQWEFSLDQLFEEFQGKQNYDVLDTSK